MGSFGVACIAMSAIAVFFEQVVAEMVFKIAVTGIIFMQRSYKKGKNLPVFLL